jgi:small subunit ribosomal protein S6
VREYEITVLIQPQMEDEERAALIQRIEGWLTSGKSETDKPVVNHWGQRSMAYPIKKFTEAYYVFFEATLDPARISEIERNMTFVEQILRHLVIVKES